jgi:hypothetical protein
MLATSTKDILEYAVTRNIINNIAARKEAEYRLYLQTPQHGTDTIESKTMTDYGDNRL